MGAQAWLLLLLPVVSATLPDQVLGMYILLADDSDKVRATHWGGPKVGPYNSTADWTPAVGVVRTSAQAAAIRAESLNLSGALLGSVRKGC